MIVTPSSRSGKKRSKTSTSSIYLGSIVSCESGTDQDIAGRIGKAITAFQILRPIFVSEDFAKEKGA